MLELLFALLKDVGSDEVVQTLDTLIEHFGPQMAPYAGQVVTALATNFMRLLDENDGDDEDDATMAAMGIMQAIATMMEALTNHPEVYATVEEPLLPVIARCCKEDVSALRREPRTSRPAEDWLSLLSPLLSLISPGFVSHRGQGEEYFEEMLEVISYLTFYQPTISARMWQVLPWLHSAFHSWAKDYINQMLPPLNNFIHRGTAEFVTRENGQCVLEAHTCICTVHMHNARAQHAHVHAGVCMAQVRAPTD